MDISGTLKVVQQALTRNSPSILTGMAVAGVITTAVMAVRATPKAMIRIAVERDIRNPEYAPHHSDSDHVELTTTDIVKLTWTAYLPAAAFGATTIACIVGANTISSKRSAALMGVYSLTRTALEEYQSKVVETIGARGDQKVRDAIAKDHLEQNPVSSSVVHITGAGEQLCYEDFSGRYFKSDIESIRKAQNDINAQVLNDMYASHNDFYQLIGLEPNTMGEESGWNTEHMMDIVFSSHLAEDGRPCLSIGYRDLPILVYYRVH